MFKQKNLSELAERKELLVLQSELHRALLQAEVANLRARWQWLGQAREKLPGGPWLLAGGAAAGFLLLRRWRTAVKWFPVLLSAWRWVRKLQPS